LQKPRRTQCGLDKFFVMGTYSGALVRLDRVFAPQLTDVDPPLQFCQHAVEGLHVFHPHRAAWNGGAS
jgi:hypothetical protein